MQHLLDHARDIVLVIGLDGRVLDANRAAVEAYGYARADLLALTIHDLRAVETVPDVAAQMQAAKTQGVLFETVHRRKSGETFECEVSSCGADHDGQTVLVSVIRDLSERRRATLALERSEQQLRSLMEALPDGVVVHRNGRVIYANRALLTYLNLGSLAEAIGQPIRSWVHPDDLGGTIDRISAMEAGQRQAVGVRETRLFRRGAREPVVAEIIGTRVDFEGAPAVMAFMRDITERRRLENELRQSQKMEAVGRLAGGVAHDFNNILTAIQGQSELLLGMLAEAAPGRRQAEHILRAASRAAALTGQLLAFSRKQMMQPRVIDLNHLLENLHPLLRGLVSEDIEVELQLAPSVQPVRADPAQIDQVLLNLVVNARDAMPDGGRVTLSTAHVERPGEPGAPPAHDVLIEVRDTGVGMDADTRAHMFEPFFTTKRKGKGTGLGLSTVYGIVTQTGGHITVESEPGQGTTVAIFLPAVEAVVDPVSGPVLLPLARGRESILLVEDDADVRRLVEEALRAQGYSVLTAHDGSEALRLAAAQPVIDLLVADVVMPRLSGPEVAAALRRERVGLRVLFMSGYTEDGALPPGVADGEFLAKPFTIAELARRVRAQLDAAL